jgi:ABC-2 type transport system permease protein
MFAEFKHTLRRFSGRIWGWGISLALYSLMLVYFYQMITRSAESMNAMLSQYPPELLAFFGELAVATTPKAYLDTYYYLYMTVIAGIFAVGAGAALLADDEERGMLDLVMAHPVSRSALFWGRWLAFATATAAILALGWVAWLPYAQRVGLNLTPLQFLLPNLPLLAELLLFGALALLLSMVLPSKSMAGSLAGALLAANWLLRGLAAMNKNLQAIMKWTPLHFYQGGLAVDGLNSAWFIGLLAAGLLLALAAQLLFQHRDIRVGGERSWALPAWMLGLLKRSLPPRPTAGK